VKASTRRTLFQVNVESAEMPEKCVMCFSSDGGGPRYGTQRCKDCLQELDRLERLKRIEEARKRPIPSQERAVTRTPGSKSTMIFYHGRKVGVVSGNAFTTYRTRNVHFVRKHGGWGLNTEVFKELKDAQVIEVILIADGTVYRVSLDDWERYGVIDTLSADDGEQIFLSEDHFREK
jgi:hypothetical protein